MLTSSIYFELIAQLTDFRQLVALLNCLIFVYAKLTCIKIRAPKIDLMNVTFYLVSIYLVFVWEGRTSLIYPTCFPTEISYR